MSNREASGWDDRDRWNGRITDPTSEECRSHLQLNAPVPHSCSCYAAIVPRVLANPRSSALLRPPLRARSPSRLLVRVGCDEMAGD